LASVLRWRFWLGWII